MASINDAISSVGLTAGGLQSAFSAFAWLILIVVFLTIAGGVSWFILARLKFNKKIVLFGNISGKGLEVVGKDVAMVIKIGKGGEECLWFKKGKVYRNAYGKRMGKNTYWFAQSDDGYWHNFVLGDLDAHLKEVGIKPTSTNMRYQYVALQQTIKDRYDKGEFWAKYGGMVAFTGLIVITGVMWWLLLDKGIDANAASAAAVEAAKDVLIETKRVIGALDSLKGTGAFVPTG